MADKDATTGQREERAGSTEIHRREFLGYGGATLAGSLLPAALAGCAPGSGPILTVRADVDLSISDMSRKVSGTQPWAVLLCTTSDRDVGPWPTQAYFWQLISPGFGGIYDFWSQVSHGAIDLRLSQVFGWFRLGLSVADIAGMRRGSLVANARATAAAAGIDLTDYYRTLVMITEFPDGSTVGTWTAYSFAFTQGQPSWRWCAKCQSLAYWNGARQPGVCSAGGRHDHKISGAYGPILNQALPGGQNGWRWCSKCESMIYGGNGSAPCAASGVHDLSGSGDYSFALGDTPMGADQAGWRWCSKCQGLAYAFNGPAPCPGGGTHDHTISGHYIVPASWVASLDWLGHETGHVLGLDHAFSDARVGDYYSDARPGAYGDGFDVMGGGTPGAYGPLFWHGTGVSATTQRKLGWLPSANLVRLAPGAGTQSIAVVPLTSGPPSALPSGTMMIQLDRPDEGVVYTAEYRTPDAANGVVWDQGLAHPMVLVHRTTSMYLAGQDSWRWCGSCEGLVNAAQTRCPLGGVHDSGGSQDYGLLLNVTPGSGQQDNWRWCSKCSGLAFAGNGTSGACPAGAGHDLSQSASYVLALSGSGEPGWRWCSKCQGLSLNSGLPGNCPAGFVHDLTVSGSYVLGTGPGSNRQNKWRKCNKCKGLYYAGFGACKGGDIHQVSGDDYAIPNGYTVAGAEVGWAFCRKCYALVRWGIGAWCAAGGTHDLSGSVGYSLPTDSELTAGETLWFSCSKCSAVHYVDPMRGPGLCPAGDRHNPVIQFIIAHDTNTVPGSSAFRWCSRCEGMVLGDNPARCPAGGPHSTGTKHYVVRTDPAMRVREMAGGRTCTKCSVLFATASADDSIQLPCASGGTHVAHGEYFLSGTATTEPFWRWCSKCGAIAYWDGSRDPGPCPGGGRHDHSASVFYDPPNFRGEVAALVAADLQVNGRYANPAGTVSFEVVSTDSDHAVIRVTSS
jgi:hypothetical protein